MKRALAERAKQSGHPSGLAPPPTTSSVGNTRSSPSSSSSPPLKVPRLEEPGPARSINKNVPAVPTAAPPQDVVSSNATTTASSSTATTTITATAPPPSKREQQQETPSSPRPTALLKRQRSSQTSLSSQQHHHTDDNDNNDSSSFYLKHQNRALASELKGLQHRLRRLEKERDVRRRQCREASDALRVLRQTWTEMEAIVTTTSRSSRSSSSKSNNKNEEEPSSSCLRHPIKSESNNNNHAMLRIPPSTGTGANVELIGVLLDSLAALGGENNHGPQQQQQQQVVKTEEGTNHNTNASAADDNDDYPDLSQFASAISKRATVLRQWISQTLLSSSLQSQTGDHDSQQQLRQQHWIELEGRVVELQSQLRDAERRVSELAVSRDDALASDRKVRRGLYRLAAGRMQLAEVLKEIELDDSNEFRIMMMAEEATTTSISSTTRMMDAAAATTESTSTVATSQPPPTAVKGEEDEEEKVAQVKKELQDMEEIAKSRETQIAQLSQERDRMLKQINELSFLKASPSTSDALSDEGVRRSNLYTETATELTTARRQLEELQTKLRETTDKYATAKGDAELSRSSLEEHLDKFQKRWSELAGGEDGSGSTDEHDDDGALVSLGDAAAQQAKRIAELEHKLKQALENVRQADTVRASLAEAHQMNEFLQAKLEEFKVKNAALVANKSAARNSSEVASSRDKPSTPGPSASSSSSSSATPRSSEKSEKPHRELRRMRKELAAAVVSKESAKEKQLRAEKERDALMKTNTRLLKQSSEKDDMNAKSLSTILHLKNLTERLATEKELLEQEAKSAEQLALAARLATNAKERLSEEVLKEKQSLEEKIKELEGECERLRREGEAIHGELSRHKAETGSLEQRVGQMKERCEELASESTKHEEERRKLLESLAVAQREANEANVRLAAMRKSQGGGAASEFTADELSQLVSVYKTRVTCPVCNNREKNCILLRCRHIFCKQCVEVNVKNRSRKCPACGQRFDTKDIADVWL